MANGWKFVGSRRRVYPVDPISPERAHDFEVQHRCPGLKNHLMSMANLFLEGWEFQRVVWGSKGTVNIPRDSRRWEYQTQKIGNNWDDLALYRRRIGTQAADDSAVGNDSVVEGPADSVIVSGNDNSFVVLLTEFEK